jgi:hypothetical protein
VHSADGWRAVLKPVIARYRGTVKRLYFRGDSRARWSSMKLPTMKAVLDDRGLRVGPDDEGCFGRG